MSETLITHKTETMETNQEFINKTLEQLAKTDMFNGEFSWGSCQYETAAATYGAFQVIKEKLGFEQALLAMGIKLPGPALPEEQVVKSFIQSEIDNELDWKTKHPNDWDEDDDEKLKILQSVELKTVQDLINFTRDHSWDLWSFAMSILPEMFKEPIQFDRLVNLMVAGPIMNELAQGENYNTGLTCALCNHFYGTSDFEGYDT